MAQSGISSHSATEVAQEWFPAPLLRDYLAPVEEGKRVVILDLGPARSVNIGFLSGFRCRLGVADAMPDLLHLDQDESDGDAQAALAAMLPPEHFGGADLILCWDLLDYLSHEGIRRLARHLRDLGGPGTAMHALVAYGVASMPSQPRGYLLDANGLWPCPAPPDDPGYRPPRHSSGELQRLMRDWRVERSVLLRNGLQEYLLRC